MIRVAGPPLLDRYVLGGVALQLAGYAALSAVIPHSDLATVVDPLRTVPTVLLVPVALLGLPAVALAVGLGTVLSLVGIQPGLWLVLVSAYLVSVIASWALQRESRNGPRAERG